MSLPSLKKYHKDTYPTIDPGRPELNQSGKTVIVGGGSTGIGFAIARGFALAGASRVIILGRRPDVVKDAASRIQDEVRSSSTVVEGRAVDISSLDETAKFWSDLESEAVYASVLVLSASAYGKSSPILEMGPEAAWADFETNVRSPLYLTDRFYKQTTGEGQKVSRPMPCQTCRGVWQLTGVVPGQRLECRCLHVVDDGPRAPDVRPYKEFRHPACAADCKGHEARQDANRELPSRRGPERIRPKDGCH